MSRSKQATHHPPVTSSYSREISFDLRSPPSSPPPPSLPPSLPLPRPSARCRNRLIVSIHTSTPLPERARGMPSHTTKGGREGVPALRRRRAGGARGARREGGGQVSMGEDVQRGKVFCWVGEVRTGGRGKGGMANSTNTTCTGSNNQRGLSCRGPMMVDMRCDEMSKLQTAGGQANAAQRSPTRTGDETATR